MIKNLPYWLVASFLLLLGVGLLYIDTTFIGTDYPTASSIINKLATAIVITGLFSLLNNLILRRSLIHLIYDKIQLRQDIDDVGVERLYTDFQDIDFRELIKQAKSNIDIVHAYGQTWTSSNEQSIIDAINKQKCSIRVVLLSKDSLMVEGLSEYYGSSKEELIKKINEVEKAWVSIHGRANGKQNKKRLQVFYSKMLPAHAIYRFDDTILKIDSRIVSKGRSRELNSLRCKDTGYEPTYFTNYLRDIELAIEEDGTTQLFNSK